MPAWKGSASGWRSSSNAGARPAVSLDAGGGGCTRFFATRGLPVRLLVKQPGVTVVALLTLAIGIGGNTAIFSAVDALLLRPLPYHEPDRLVKVWEKRAAEGVLDNVVAPADFIDWARMNTVFEEMAAYVGDHSGPDRRGRTHPPGRRRCVSAVLRHPARAARARPRPSVARKPRPAGTVS